MELKAFLPGAWTQFQVLFRKFFKKTFVGTQAEWDALSTAEKKEYDIANITDDTADGELVVSDAVTAGDLNPVTSNAVADSLSYSTNEVKTGAKWIDDKPIYRKCYVVTSNFSDAFNMPSNIDFITNIRLMTQATNGNQVGLYYSPNPIDTYDEYITSGFYNKQTNQWTPQVGAIRVSSASKWVYIFEYTKTTD